MNPKIENLAPKKLVGKCLKMSLATNKTKTLWSSFMPFKKSIPNTINSDLYSLQVYETANFDPKIEFTKWALIEVTSFENMLENFKPFNLTGGLYAVFLHKGSSADFSIFRYIFYTWLPNSDYELDHRPHFEVLGAQYKNNSSSSQEEIWIPIKQK